MPRQCGKEEAAFKSRGAGTVEPEKGTKPVAWRLARV